MAKEIDYKSFLQSKTIWGIVIMAFSAIARGFGYEVTQDTQDGVLDGWMVVVNMLPDLAGAALAVWGRVTAVKKLSV